MQVIHPPVYDPVTDILAPGSLDYTLAGSYPAAIFLVARCPLCGLRYAIASQDGVMWYFAFDEGGDGLRSPLAQVINSEPICPSCLRQLELYSLASVLSSEGDWLHLGPVGSGALGRLSG